jgi:hypothetical protein
MSKRMRAGLGITLAVGLGVTMTGCSDTSSDRSGAEPTSVKAVTSTTVRFDPSKVGAVTVSGPITSGNGKINVAGGKVDLASVGYTEAEYFIAGTATSYTSDTPLTSDGAWTVREDASAPYTTRIVVRRPTSGKDFSGNVVVEWLNVSGGLDAAPDWTMAHVELIRRGWAWVGVSAQSVGVVGGGGAVGAAFALKVNDPVRYGPLVHPGDSFSYDMFSQAGAAVHTQFDTLLGGTEPERVLAMGESQSAFRLTTYVNAVAPLAGVFDGYLIHSRGDSGAPLAEVPQTNVPAPETTLMRTDLGVPVMVVESETDVMGDRLGYVRARQPDAEWFRAWEMAGTAHADAYSLGIGDTDDGSGAGDAALFAAMSSPPSKVYGGVISCDSPINSGPQTYVIRAAVRAMVTWMHDGTPAPKMPRLELNDSETEYVVDANGNAKGGVRTPQVDAPIAKLSGLGQTGTSFCGLFGTTVPFDAAALAAAYPDHATFVKAWNAAIAKAARAKALVEEDAERLRSVAASSTIGG